MCNFIHQTSFFLFNLVFTHRGSHRSHMSLQVEPPEKKRSRKKKPTTHASPPPSFSLLPDEIAVNCLARIPRAYYPRLSIISKSFRSLLSSEQCLFDETLQCPQWSTLWINPNPTLKKKKKTLEDNRQQRYESLIVVLTYGMMHLA